MISRACGNPVDSTILLLSKSEISSLKPSSVAAQPCLCRTWSETLKTGILSSRLIFLISALKVGCGYSLELPQQKK